MSNVFLCPLHIFKRFSHLPLIFVRYSPWDLQDHLFFFLFLQSQIQNFFELLLCSNGSCSSRSGPYHQSLLILTPQLVVFFVFVFDPPVHIKNLFIISFQYFLISLFWIRNVDSLYQSVPTSVLALWCWVSSTLLTY